MNEQGPLRPGGLLAPLWRRQAIILLCMIGLAVSSAIYGLLAGPLMKALFGGETLSWPTWLAPHLPPPPSVETLRGWIPALVIGAAAIKAIAALGQQVGLVALGQAVVRQARLRLHVHLLRMSPDELAAQGHSVALSAMTQEAEALDPMVREGLAPWVGDGLQVLALLAGCAVLSPTLAAVTVIVYPFAFWPMVGIGRKARRAGHRAHDHRAEVLDVARLHLDRLPLIQARGITGWARQRGEAAINRATRSVVRLAISRSLGAPLMEILGAAAVVLAITLATDQIAQGHLAAEHLMSFLACLLMIYRPAKGLARAHGALQPGLAALARINDLLQRPAARRDQATQPVPEGPLTVEIEGLSLSRGGRPVIEGLDLTLSPGRIVAVSGPNGVGKTTLIWALCRLIEAGAGACRVNGQPLHTLRVEAWRAALGWVPQAPWISPGTLLDNVNWGHEQTPAPEALERVAALAGLKDLLARAGGWDAQVGEGGAGLSGGERRRIALARALVTRPRVLLLDEPDAHLDAQGLADLLNTLNRLRADHAVLLVAHDPRVLAAADVCVELTHLNAATRDARARAGDRAA